MKMKLPYFINDISVSIQRQNEGMKSPKSNNRCGKGIDQITDNKKPRISAGLFIRIGRRERIRTSDPLVPNQLRYQAALLAEILLFEFLVQFVKVVVRGGGLEPPRP